MKFPFFGSLGLFGFLIVLAGMFCQAPAARAELDLDFELKNSTGYAIKEIYIAPSSQEEWEPTDKNVLPRGLQDGESIRVSFHPDSDAAEWDLKIVWVDGGDVVEWLGFDLSEISKITLLYNDDTGATTAETE
jgi:hypothetical protein